MDADAVLELWQFSVTYDELPWREGAEPIDNCIYRSREWPKLVFVYHAINDSWGCFRWKDY